MEKAFYVSSDNLYGWESRICTLYMNFNYAYWFHYLDIHMETNGKQKLGGSFVFSRSKETDSGVCMLKTLGNETKYIHN